MKKRTETPIKDSKDQKPVSVWLPEFQGFREIDAKTDKSRPVADALQAFLLTSMQLQNVVVLAGSGASLGAGGPSMGTLWDSISKVNEFEEVRKQANYPDGVNIEDFLSRCATRIEFDDDETASTFYDNAVKTILDECRKFLQPGARVPEHELFLRKLARRRTRDARLKLFTTNYDLCFERAASQLGLTPIDGFSFGSERRFDPRFFDYDIVKSGTRAEGHDLVPGVFQYFKLHGSVNWAQADGQLVIDEAVDADSACLIYPARTKFQISYQQPHLELMARYLASLREPNTCLVCVGFGFQDDHLTAPILAALESNPHFRVVIVSPHCDNHFLEKKSPHWQRLNELATSTDLALVTANFGQFSELLPNLRALTPGDDLMRVVRNVVGGSRD